MNGYNQPGSPYQPIPPAVWTRPVRRCANIICFALASVYLLTYTIFPVLVQILAYFIRRMPPPGPAAISTIETALGLIFYIAAFLTAIILIRYWVGIPTRVAVPLRLPRPGIALPAVFVCLGVVDAGLLASATLSALLQTLFGFTPTMPPLSQPVGPAAAVLQFLSVAVAPAILEEILFRGVVMQTLRQFGDGFALVVSAVLFAFAHGNLLQGPNALLMGIAIGYFVLRTGSLLTGMLIHFVNNAVSLLLVWLSSAVGRPEAVNMAAMAVYFFAGSVALVVLTASQSNMFRIAPSNYPLPASKKFLLFFSSPLPVMYTVATIIVTAQYVK